MSRDGALWIGGLEPYMDEEFIMRSLRLMGEDAISVKVIKNKFTGEPASYGFINFLNDPAALMAMHKLNGKIIPNSHPPTRFKLNHQSTRLMPGERDYSVWVGDITTDVDDLQLFKFFSVRFHTIRSAKVVLDSSGQSKGYGFIRFGSEDEQQSALAIMQGISGLGGKPIKVSIAVPKPKDGSSGGQGHGGQGHGGGQFPSSFSSSSSLADSLPPSALALVVANASGNPKAGDQVVAEAAQQQYQQYWQQYSQQYWSQYAAWQYSQQYYDQNGYYNQGQEEEYSQENVNEEDDDLALIEHSEPLDTEFLNFDYLGRSEELWEAVEISRWWHQQEITD